VEVDGIGDIRVAILSAKEKALVRGPGLG